MSAGYSIRIDFDTEKERPERMFQSMSLYIEGFNDLQEAFVRGCGFFYMICKNESKTVASIT